MYRPGIVAQGLAWSGLVLVLVPVLKLRDSKASLAATRFLSDVLARDSEHDEWLNDAKRRRLT